MTKNRVFEATARLKIFVATVDHDPQLEACRSHFLAAYRNCGGVGLGNVAASEMIHAIGRFLNEAEKGTKRPLFYSPTRITPTTEAPLIGEHGEYTLAETAAYLDLGISTTRRHLLRGRFPGHYRGTGRGGGYWIPGSAILAFEKEEQR